MASSSIIVTKNQKQQVPDKVLEKAVEGHTAIGTAFVDETGLIVQKQAAPFSLETFKEYQDTTKELAIVSVFQTMTTPINEAHVQPFVEETKEGDEITTHFAVFVDGDVSKYALPKQPQTAEEQWFQKAFLPLLEEYAKTTKNEPSIQGFMDYITVQKAVIENSLGERGVVKVIAETGQILTFIKSGGMFKDTWGEISSGYSESTFPTKIVEEKKTASIFSKAKPSTVIHNKEPDKKTDTSVPVISMTPEPPDGYIWARPIATVRKHDKTFKKTLMAVLAGLPKGWPTMEWFAVPKGKDLGRNWEYKDQGAIAEAIAKAMEKKGPSPEDLRKGLVPEKMQEDFKTKFVPSLNTKDVPNLPTLEELQADENKHPTWFDKTGIHVQDTINWPAAKLEELDSDYHALYVLRQRAITNMLIKMMHEHPPATKDESEEEVVSVKSETSKEEIQKNLQNLNKDLTTPAAKARSFFRKAG